MRSVGSLLAAAWLAFHLGAGSPLGAGIGGGGSPIGASVRRLEQAARQPLPALPVALPRPAAEVWVPGRWVDTLQGPAHVPGHWERPVAGGRVYVPPLVSCTAAGQCAFHPAGERLPAERRPLEP